MTRGSLTMTAVTCGVLIFVLGLDALCWASGGVKSIRVPMVRRARDPRSDRHGRRLTGTSAALKNVQETQYLLEVQIGKSRLNYEQNFTMIPDTGSADVWIPSVRCSTCTEGAHRYDVDASSTALWLGQIKSEKYGDLTSIEGRTLLDRLAIVGVDGGNVTVERQFMLEVTDYESPQAIMMSDGILGLSHYTDMERHLRNASTFIRSLFRENPSMPRHFSFYLTPDAHGSALTFGDPLLDQHAKRPSPLPPSASSSNSSMLAGVTFSDPYWMRMKRGWHATINGIALSGSGEEVSFRDEPHRVPALIDSGTSLIVMKHRIFDRLAEQLMAKRLCTPRRNRMTDQLEMYCKCPSRMGWFSEPYPRLRLEIIDQAGNPFPLCVAPEEYVIEIRRPFGFCTGVLGIERGESLPVAVILGMTFLRSYYVIFDLTDPHHNRMGFVRSAASVLPADATCPVEKDYLEPGSLARMAHCILMNLALWVFIVVGLAAAAWWLFMKARRHYNRVDEALLLEDRSAAMELQTIRT
ncbi:unnamed protein product [Vitrella brassicaformis CCMP3155]|uniref:Peptidase A1 domain-containing protein n=1 Tax=Vitrella brassicaformis (strain CCMP3155) TaxID=1169540 RepID=A0A0G4E8I1_VITBC|nr:unnamed protein product [Vitrella brassicaformis CCMP3155]|mmetsp:Transcript_27974/g.80508  ORF Transcript_27974/g.80508 Transcript_27974/m.80508 type:complete len:524 (-) Transcript_27974:128-1699(-)|eukprot:CEL92078.1 unnamed protein product [Vitrella brassicaformis CCMP3155]